SDLTGAVIWRTSPPPGESAAIADLAQVALVAPSAEELAKFAGLGGDLDNPALRLRMSEGTAPLADGAQSAAWANSAEQQLWQGLIQASQAAAEGYKGRLTDYLVRLLCSSRFADGAVAMGVARRALEPAFKGDVSAIYNKLKGTDCPAARA